MNNKEDFRNRTQFPSVNDQLDYLFIKIQESYGEEKYESMVNFSRSLVESTCKFIYFYKNKKELEESNLNNIVKKTLEALNIEFTSPFYENLRKIINEVGKVRDRNNISHGIRKRQANLGENESWLYTVLCVDFCNYLLRLFYNQNVDKNIIGGLIAPPEEHWVDFKSKDGFKIQVRDDLKQYFIGYATITIDKDIELKEVIKLAENSINELLPNDIRWKSRKQDDLGKFHLYSYIFDRKYEITFEKSYKAWVIYLDNINTSYVLSNNTKQLVKYPFKAENFYNLSNTVLASRIKLNESLENGETKLIKATSKNLIKHICLEICKKNSWEKVQGDIQQKVLQTIKKFNPSKLDLLNSILNNLGNFIKFPKLSFSDNSDYLIYTFFVDDLCLYLIKKEKSFLVEQNNVPQNIIGGKLNITEFENMDKISECEYMINDNVVDTTIYVSDKRINKVYLNFKLSFDMHNELVTEKVKDYLPKEVKFMCDNHNQIIYSLNETVKYKVNYKINRKGLLEVEIEPEE